MGLSGDSRTERRPRRKNDALPSHPGSPGLQTLLNEAPKFRNPREPLEPSWSPDTFFPPEQVLRECTRSGHVPTGLDHSHVLPPASPSDQESEAETPKEAERLESKEFPPLTFIGLL